MAEIRLPYRWVPSALEPLPSLTHEGPWCPGCSVPTGYKLEQRSCRCRCNGLQPWTINMQRHPKTKGTLCRRQRTYHGFKDGDGRKARRLRRPASRLRGLTTIPILEVWAAVVVMPLYAYDEKDFTERSPLDSAHISCRLTAAHKSAALGHVWTAPGWQELSSRVQQWSEQPCVRPVSAVHLTAGRHSSVQ